MAPPVGAELSNAIASTSSRIGLVCLRSRGVEKYSALQFWQLADIGPRVRGVQKARDARSIVLYCIYRVMVAYMHHAAVEAQLDMLCLAFDAATSMSRGASPKIVAKYVHTFRLHPYHAVKTSLGLVLPPVLYGCLQS